jgi:hypothetical protein
MSIWNYRKDKRSNDKAHGITFYMWERAGEQIRGEWSGQGKKALVDGRCSLTVATNQYKYGNELIAQIYTKNMPVVTERQADNYTRVQIYLGEADLETAKALEQMANLIRYLHES